MPPPASGPPGQRQPILNAPSVVAWLTGVTIFVHALRLVAASGWFGVDDAVARAFFTLAFIPARYTAPSAWEHELLALLVSPVGHAFLHAGWLHLFVNMGFLLAFGSAVARRMATGPFLLLYALTAAVGAFAFTLSAPAEITPLVGASGAVFGMLGAILRIALMPPAGARPAPFPFNHRRTALAFGGAYLVVNLLMGAAPAAFGVESRIAWEAHLGGFIAGFILMPYLDGRGKRRRRHSPTSPHAPPPSEM